MKKTPIIISLLILMANCHQATNHNPGLNTSNPGILKEIKLEISDSSLTNLEPVLVMDSYTILSSQIPTGQLKRVLIVDDYIYILDKQSRLICFNPDGEVAFHIFSKGKGPGEFSVITDMAIDTDNEILTLADQSLRKLIRYSSKNGKYLGEERLKVSLSAMAWHHGTYYFYNPFHYNYPQDKEMHFSLLSSDNGSEINGRFFPHDPGIENYMYDDAFRQFSYNADEIYFRRRFQDTIFSISKNGIEPRYSFILPDPLPYSYIQQRPNSLELATKATYSSTIYSVFKCENIMYMNFFKDQLVVTTFYDLDKDEIIFCGKHVAPLPSKELPAFSHINGVYKGRFFSLIYPDRVMSSIKMNPDVFPADWLSLNENSNPVVVFYKLSK